MQIKQGLSDTSMKFQVGYQFRCEQYRTLRLEVEVQVLENRSVKTDEAQESTATPSPANRSHRWQLHSNYSSQISLMLRLHSLCQWMSVRLLVLGQRLLLLKFSVLKQPNNSCFKTYFFCRSCACETVLQINFEIITSFQYSTSSSDLLSWALHLFFFPPLPLDGSLFPWPLCRLHYRSI